MSRRKFLLLIALALFISVLLQCGLLVKGLFAISADESGRTIDAFFWVTGDSRISDVWLPFYRILIGYGLLLHPDLFLLPRIFSFTFGLGVCCVLGWLTHELFQKREITLLAMFASALFPPRLVLSTVPLTEIFFIFFTVAALASFVRWQNTQRLGFVLLAGFLFGMTTTIRYEAWVFSATFALYVTYLLRKTKQSDLSLSVVMTICTTICLFPLYWIINDAMREGNPFFFLTKTSGRYDRVASASVLKLIWRNVLFQFLFWNSLCLNTVGIFSLFSLSRLKPAAKQLSLLVGIPLILLSGFELVGRTLPTHNPWRIAAVWGVLALPLMSHFLSERFRHSRSLLATVCVIAVVLCFAQTLYLSGNSSFGKGEKSAGEFLEQQIAKNTGLFTILIENPDWTYLNIMVASQHPEYFVFNSGYDPHDLGEPFLDPAVPLRPLLLKEKRIKYLALKTPSYKNYVLQYAFVQNAGQFGEWSVFEFVGTE